MWSRPVMTPWADFLTTRDVYIDTSGKKSRATSLVDILFRKENIPARKADRYMAETREELRAESDKDEHQKAKDENQKDEDENQ